MNAELQGYTDPNGVSSTARPVDHHTSASAQNGEASFLESGRRSDGRLAGEGAGHGAREVSGRCRRTAGPVARSGEAGGGDRERRLYRIEMGPER